MLDYSRADFSAPSTCGRDQGVQRLVASTRAVPFQRVGHVACIEVVGIPALKCQVCDEQSYDLTLLAHIESVLSMCASRVMCRHRIRLSNWLLNSRQVRGLTSSSEPVRHEVAPMSVSAA